MTDETSTPTDADLRGSMGDLRGVWVDRAGAQRSVYDSTSDDLWRTAWLTVPANVLAYVGEQELVAGSWIRSSWRRYVPDTEDGTPADSDRNAVRSDFHGSAGTPAPPEAPRGVIAALVQIGDDLKHAWSVLAPYAATGHTRDDLALSRPTLDAPSEMHDAECETEAFSYRDGTPPPCGCAERAEDEPPAPPMSDGAVGGIAPEQAGEFAELLESLNARIDRLERHHDGLAAAHIRLDRLERTVEKLTRKAKRDRKRLDGLTKLVTRHTATLGQLERHHDGLTLGPVHAAPTPGVAAGPMERVRGHQYRLTVADMRGKTTPDRGIVATDIGFAAACSCGRWGLGGVEEQAALALDSYRRHLIDIANGGDGT